MRWKSSVLSLSSVVLLVSRVGLADVTRCEELRASQMAAPSTATSTAQTHIVAPGDTWSMLAQRLWGSEFAAPVLMMQGSETLIAGRSITLLPMADWLAHSGLERKAPGTELHLSAAWEIWLTWRSVVQQARQAGRTASVTRFPREACVALQSAAAHLQDTIVLMERASVRSPARSTLGQLRSALSLLQAIALGHDDGYSYDIVDFERRFFLGVRYAVLWSRESRP